MNKILMVSIKGCESCAIMRDNIKTAVDSTFKEVEFIEKDLGELSRDFKDRHRFRDFPTTLFIKDDVIVRRQVGSYPIAVIHRWMDIDFKQKK